MVDVGLVIESLIGGAYCSSYTRKAFRAACSRLQKVRSPQLVPLAASAGTVMNLPSTQPRLREGRGPSLSRQRLDSGSSRSPHQLHFFRTAQPSKPKVEFSLRLPQNPGVVQVRVCMCAVAVPPMQEQVLPAASGRENSASAAAPPQLSFNFNDLFVWAVLQQRQQMALFLWQHGEEALARATVACKLYRSMALAARRSSMDDSTVERLKTFSQ